LTGGGLRGVSIYSLGLIFFKKNFFASVREWNRKKKEKKRSIDGGERDYCFRNEVLESFREFLFQRFS
jgi:hypothetical protein